MVSRTCGLLLHITSLPGRSANGTLGPEARRLVDQLAALGIEWWQTLPIGPPGYAGSPYDSPSAFAGGTHLISLEDLTSQSGAETKDPRSVLRRAFEHPALDALQAFREREASWLEDYATFMALSARFVGQERKQWPRDVRTIHGEAVAAARRELAQEIDFECWLQMRFFEQWSALRKHAHTAGVRMIGDMPIYVSCHSADVWSQPSLFELDDDSRPTEVAAVPPDDFSETGQLWGQPVYRWSQHRADDYAWWRARINSGLERFDLLRIDHFRGLVAGWRVPAGAATAEHGRWARGPGRRLWKALEADSRVSLEGHRGLPRLFAEDLGHITASVRRLLRESGLWGTRVLQFADGPGSEHHPAKVPPETVYYTGTHDNDTTRGWLEGLAPDQRVDTLRFLDVEPGLSTRDQVRAIVAGALASRARMVVLPLQDVLGLGSQARMNTPGTTTSNWSFRAPPAALETPEAAWLVDALRSTKRLARAQGGAPS